MQIFTTTLSSGELTLNRVDGAIVISIQSKTGGEALFTGNAKPTIEKTKILGIF